MTKICNLISQLIEYEVVAQNSFNHVHYHQTTGELNVEMINRHGMSKPATSHVSGMIKTLDAAAHTVTLDSGRICQCAISVDLTGFKTGDKINAGFVEKNGKTECCEMASAV